MAQTNSNITKPVVPQQNISFEHSLDPFYSESNLAYLRQGIEALNADMGCRT